ncbi:MAG: ABC transporter ATP-binding protein [Planctomycetota bacterium]
MSIAAEQLTVRYGRLTALREVTATAGAGRITAVLGPNASGKSTLLRALVGVRRPDAGHALLDGGPAHAVRTGTLARRVAYVPQRPVVAASFTVRQVVELGRFSLPPDPPRIAAVLDELDLARLRDRVYPALSVGQQQRVTLGRALAQLAPDGHLVLDEPASAMDLRHVRRAHAALRRRADGGATVLVALHDIGAAAGLADDAWLLDGGRLVAAGPVADVLDPRRLEDVFGVGFEWVRRDGRAPMLVADGPGGAPPAP